MPYPSVTWTNILPPAVRQEAEQFAALTQGYLSVEHKDDGSHRNITADSIVTTGDITAGGDLIGEADLEIAGDGAFGGDLSAANLTQMQTPPFSASNFTGNGGMTWTVSSVDTFQYCVIGNTMFVNFIISGTVGGSLNTTLRIQIPGGYTCVKRTLWPICTSSATFALGAAQIAAGGTLIECDIIGASWVAGTGVVYGQVFFEV